ncbi:hypothetical protein A8C76_28685 [Escherichia coli]|nr:hypothetical protein A8C76_28685 [Escherichia coli]SQR31011.1 Uncharacterised protein [Escherichia coli]
MSRIVPFIHLHLLKVFQKLIYLLAFISSRQIISMINILIQQVTVGYSIIQAAAAMPTSDGIKSATN